MPPQQLFRCVLIGSESILVQCASVLLERGHSIAAVVTDSPEIARWCRDGAVARLDPEQRLAERLGSVDLLFAISYAEPLPASLRDLPRVAAIRFLEAPVSAWEGANLPSWGLLDGASRWGVSWYLEPVSGDEPRRVVLTREFEVSADETALTLNARCYEHAIESFTDLLSRLESGPLEARPVPAVRQRRPWERPSALALLDWTRPATELERIARALDHGRYANPLAVPKLLAATGRVLLVDSVRATSGASGFAPGALLGRDGAAVRVAVADGEVRLTGIRSAAGKPLDPAELDAIAGPLPTPPASLRERIDARARDFARHEPFWRRRLARLAPIELPQAAPASRADRTRDRADPLIREVEIPKHVLPAQIAAAFFAYLQRVSGSERFHVSFCGPAQRACAGELAGLFADRVPLEAIATRGTPFALLHARVDAELRRVERRGSFALDLFARAPELHGAWDAAQLGVALEITEDARGAASRSVAPIGLAIASDGSRAALAADPRRIEAPALERIAEQLANLLASGLHEPDRPIGALRLLSAAEDERLIEQWNRTALEHDRSRCVHELIAEQAARTPTAVALVDRERSFTYAELEDAAERLARRLRALGVAPDVLVGLCLERSLGFVIAALAVWKAGGAYVPLDPAFPPERIALMIEDSQAPVLVTETRLLPQLPRHAARLVCIDRELATSRDDEESSVPRPRVAPENLAYAIYTSGSTGRPKGVLVEHRNVVNFFRGMDERLPCDAPGVWLSLTSPSFDISVLELFWTLTRGFRVVIEPDLVTSGSAPRLENAARPIDFSLFFFASDESAGSRAKYRLLLDAARFADQSGFSAVWTPERHFHAFGGLYPNPAVTGAALAAITERIRIRAGSCVLPLHNPIRIAEEWAVVDNLSGGRVDVSFASGWQPNDFALRPENFANAKAVMLDGIETVRRLWRGETIEFPGPKGPVAVRTLPRPVQAELPVWITTAGTAETWRAAAERGAAVLTHLLGQTLDQLAEKIELYRKCWDQAGHPGHGHVTLMLHTFVWDDEAVVLEHARGPMKDYLRSSVGLIKEAAWSFPAFRKRLDRDGASPEEIFAGGLSEEEMEALLEHSFQRYYRTGSLLGTPDQCIELVDRLKGIDVDEVACQIDFGIPEDLVLTSLEHLKRVMAGSQPTHEARAESVPQLCQRYAVTHLQCTPSAAQMFLLGEEDRSGLEGLEMILIGGEAFPSSLAAQLQGLGRARVLNMYGPTETTIWSATWHLADAKAGENIPLGRPIANTRLYVVDPQLQLLPQGVPGELLIGGEGVARGYHERPELTAERFLPDPFQPGSGERVYRTGDLVRWREDGSLEFLGRIDHQVKIRGYRIELGEIESLLLEAPQVREAVAIVREDSPGDQRLVAYVVPAAGAAPDPAQLRAALRARLPEYMVPAAVVVLERFPLTPNAKIDRKALPVPERVRRLEPAAAIPAAPLENELQRRLAVIWAEALQLEHVGLDDNFFDLGGHSLLAVQVHRRIRAEIERPLSITDLFRLPTLRALAEFLAGEGDGGERVAEDAQKRAEARRKALERRRPRGAR